MHLSQSTAINTIAELLGNIVDDEDLVLNSATTADEVEDWDSLAHVNLILALEAHYKIKFDTREINASENVGQLAELLLSKAA